MSEELSGRLRAAARFLRTFIKWLAIASVTGAVGGLIGSAFHLSVDGANSLRESFPWLLWLLPVIGVLIALIYRYTHLESEGTNAVIDSIHLGEKIPLALVPVIFASTVLTHLGGGSAGREGAALQIGGGLGWSMGRLFRLDDKDMRLATLCGMSALFSALFGTPLTATIFALEVISVGVVYYSGLVPCLTAALAAFGVTQLFDIAPTRFTVEAPALSADMLWRVAVLGIACAAMSIVFCETMHKGERLISRAVRNPYLRAAGGGLVIIALTYLCGTTDYNGAGTAVISRAVTAGEAEPLAFALKLLFTAVTLGCVLGPLLGIPAGFAAAVGLVALFCGAVNCPVASVILAVELFGSGGIVYSAVACAIAYMLSGYTGLYSSQKIMYSKLRAEFIDIHAK